jgi:hypothetical protein
MDGTDTGPVAAAVVLEAQTVLANTAAEQAAEDMGEALVVDAETISIQSGLDKPAQTHSLSDRDKFYGKKTTNAMRVEYIYEQLMNFPNVADRIKTAYAAHFFGVERPEQFKTILKKLKTEQLNDIYDWMTDRGASPSKAARAAEAAALAASSSSSSSSVPRHLSSDEIQRLESPDPTQYGEGFGRKGRLGPKPRRVVYGSGVRQEDAQSKMYYLSDEHFKRGQLCVKYTSTGKMKIRPIAIDAATKRCILDVIAQAPDREQKIAVLPAPMRRIVQMFRRTINNPDDEIHDEDLDKLFDDWQIFRGEYTAGNTGPAIRRGLRKTTMELMQIKRISQHQGMQVLAMLGAQD